jgi:hypothetical protein
VLLGVLRVKSQLSTFSLHFESVDLVIADVRARSLRVDVQDGHVLNRGSKDARPFSGKLQCPGGRKTRTGGTGNSSPGAGCV